MSFNTLPDWLHWLEQQHPKSIDLGLDRISAVAERLGVTSFKATVITVAGTNGKGSFVASLAALLRAHNQKVACYTSPHFIKFNERIDLNGVTASDQQLIEAFHHIYNCLDGESLTYFEFTTLAAFYIFQQDDFDQIILEVGLGGRLDAVNIINPDFAAITSIAIDHQEYLSDDLEKIAFEKCGILRDETPMVCAEISPPDTLLEAIESHNSLHIGRDYEYLDQGQYWSFSSLTMGIECKDILSNGLSIPSQSAAICVAKQLLKERFETRRIAPELGNLSLPGRFQRFEIEGLTVILDVAHNIQAASLLLSRLSGLPLATGKKRFAVFNMLEDKDVGSITALMNNTFDKWFIGGINSSRANKPETIKELLAANSDSELDVSDNIQQAFDKALEQSDEGDQIIVFGSFYVVAELLPRLGKL